MYRADLKEQWMLLNLIMQRPVRQLVPRGEYTDIDTLDNYPPRTEAYMQGVNEQIKVHLKAGGIMREADALQDKAGMSFSGMVSRAEPADLHVVNVVGMIVRMHSFEVCNWCPKTSVFHWIVCVWLKGGGVWPK